MGDPDKPKLVFFFDEAHLLFNDAPKVLLDKIEQVVRLIRSKGVGVYFVTQSPLDVPETVLGQLGNRVQHALRAFTPKDQKAVRVAAQTFRQNPELDTEATITALGVGEALVSTLDAQGIPGIVERVNVAPPGSRLGPIDAGRAPGGDGPVPGQGGLRRDHRPGLGLRDAGAAGPGGRRRGRRAQVRRLGRPLRRGGRHPGQAAGARAAARVRSRPSPAAPPARSAPRSAVSCCAGSWARCSATKPAAGAEPPAVEACADRARPGATPSATHAGSHHGHLRLHP